MKRGSSDRVCDEFAPAGMIRRNAKSMWPLIKARMRSPIAAIEAYGLELIIVNQSERAPQASRSSHSSR